MPASSRLRWSLTGQFLLFAVLNSMLKKLPFEYASDAWTGRRSSVMVSPRNSQLGISNVGSIVLETCTISHAPIRYSPAIWIALRRLRSARNVDLSVIAAGSRQRLGGDGRRQSDFPPDAAKRGSSR